MIALSVLQILLIKTHTHTNTHTHLHTHTNKQTRTKRTQTNHTKTTTMLFSQKTIAAVAALMLTVPSATGHIILKTPKPFKFDGDGESNPVSRDGKDFPCRVKAYTVDGERTQMPIGSKQAATFSGSATHTGGSCQFSLSKDLEPTKDSEWMVIHSVMGGCVGRQSEGYESGTYEFSIPEGIPAGDYSFLFTWYARATGEVYAECAPVTVTAGPGAVPEQPVNQTTGSSTPATPYQYGKRAREFPEVFMANMGEVSNGCNVPSNQIGIEFPDPGESVELGQGEDAKLQKPSCDGNPRARKNGGGGQAGPTAQPDVPGYGNGSGPASSPAGGSATGAPVATATAPAQQPPASVPAGSPACSTVTVTTTVTAGAAAITGGAGYGAPPPAYGGPSGFSTVTRPTPTCAE